MLEKLSTKSILKDWLNRINELITVIADKLDATANAVSASKLYTSRKINNTSFDGTKDITTSSWGTARNISITDGTNTSTAVSVNGSTDYNLNLPKTIDATVTKSLNDGDGNNISSTYLKLSGGTMTGIIKSSSDQFIVGTSSTSRRHICAGTSYNEGAYLALDGKDVPEGTSNYVKGQFILGTHNGTNNPTLTGRPDGTLLWNSKQITLAGDCLPLSGGTMSGNLSLLNAYSGRTTGSVTMGIGSAWNDAPSISMYGINDSTNPGYLELRAGANTHRLGLNKDGTLSWSGSFWASNGNIQTKSLELSGITPFIDFHFNNTTSDYTSRIIETASGLLSVNGMGISNGGFTAYANSAIQTPSGPSLSLRSTGTDGSKKVIRASTNGNIDFGNESLSSGGGVYIPTDDMNQNGKWYAIITSRNISSQSVGSAKTTPNVSVPTTWDNNGVKTWTLPSGGTWKYMFVDSNTSDSHYYHGTAAGGQKFTVGSNIAGIAIRIS